MSALERLRDGLFMDRPKYTSPSPKNLEAWQRLRSDAGELADTIEAELKPICTNRARGNERVLMCSRCGAFTKVSDASEYMNAKYCGWCGAKVVEQ